MDEPLPQHLIKIGGATRLVYYAGGRDDKHESNYPTLYLHDAHSLQSTLKKYKHFSGF